MARTIENSEIPIDISAKSKSAEVRRINLSFDRGTILLRPKGDSSWLESIPGVLWDGRVSAFRAPASDYQALRQNLRARNVQIHDEVEHSWESNFGVGQVRGNNGESCLTMITYA